MHYKFITKSQINNLINSLFKSKVVFMATIGVSTSLSSNVSLFCRRGRISTAKRNPTVKPFAVSKETRRSFVEEKEKTSVDSGGASRIRGGEFPVTEKVVVSSEDKRSGLKYYFDEAKELIRSDGGGGGGRPRWFSPLQCGSHPPHSPLLLYLPGFFFFVFYLLFFYFYNWLYILNDKMLIVLKLVAGMDGVGAGLTMQHRRLGE